MQPVVEIQVNGKVPWNVTQTPSGNFVAVCEPLGLAMEGYSLDDLFRNISEAIQLVMNDLLRAGELNQFLSAKGWRALNLVNVPTTDQPVAFSIPVELLMQAQRDSARAIRQ
jgi:predicted RNase H-like HicB family nuclease